MNKIENPNELPETYGTVPFLKVKRALQKCEEDAIKKGINLEELEVTFEYLVGSFFPEVLKNVHDEANKQYTKGYIAGLAAREKV